MKKILFLTRSLNAGGAERQLVITAKELVKRDYQVTVLTFYSGGFYAKELSSTKVHLHSLNKKGRWDMLAFYFRLIIQLKKEAPDVLYSFLGNANIFSVLARPFIERIRIVWGIRASNMDLNRYDWAYRFSYWLERRLAPFSDCIIANSHAGFEYAGTNGFPWSKMRVIPNGIDTNQFRPDREAGEKLRQTWGINGNEKLVGLIGRIEPMKGHSIFLEAAALLKQRFNNIRFVCVGKGKSKYEHAMHERAIELGLEEVLIWAGIHTNMLAVYNALDIAVSSSSYGEGFPNIVGEAMACGVPCIVTDVGDSARIVGDPDLVVEPRNPEQLAHTIFNTLQRKEENNWTEASRKRIEENFSINRLIDLTEQSLSGNTSVD